MDRKKVSTSWVIVACLLLIMPSYAESPYKRRFLRPILRERTQFSGRAQTAETGRGLLKHLLSFKSLFQQPQSNVIIITRPAESTDDTTTTTATSPGTTRMPNPDDNDYRLEDNVNSPLIYNGINDKISRESTEAKDSDRSTRKNNNNKRRRKNRTRNHHGKKNIADTEISSDLRKERNDNSRRRKRLRKTTGKLRPHSNRDQNEEFLRMIDSIRQYSSKD